MAQNATMIANGALENYISDAEMAPFPLAIWHERGGVREFVYSNAAFSALTGFSPTDLSGMPVESIVPTLSIEACPSGVVDQRTRHSACYRKSAGQFEALVLSTPIARHIKGTRFFSMSLVDVNVVDVLTPTAPALSEIYADAPGFIALSDGPEHRLTYVNSSFLDLVGNRPMVGLKVADALPELGPQGFITMLDSVFQSGHPSTGRHTPVRFRRNPDGSEELCFVNFIYQPVRNQAGQVTGLFCEGSDVTDAHSLASDLRKARSELAHLSRVNSMGTMAATLAHELNQPLAAIENYASGCLHILESDQTDRRKLVEGLSAIAAATDRAGKVIKHLREMTKRAAPVREEFDLSTALEETAELIKAGGCENVSISTQCRSSLFVVGDKIQIQQIIINLLRNACEAAASAEHEGLVSATSLLRGDNACVVIKDNGPGLSRQSESNVFGWYESSKPGGMGVGLSICRTIAEAHGGQVLLDATGPQGSSFSFCMPRVL